jgi:hypothetical protein
MIAAPMNPKIPPNQTQQQTSSQQLPDQPAAACSHRHSDGNFAPPPCRHGQQQVCDIGARRQQHKNSHYAQERNRGAEIKLRSERGFPERKQFRPLRNLVVGIAAQQLVSQHRHRRLCRFQLYPGL